jgi:hypothetical protein
MLDAILFSLHIQEIKHYTHTHTYSLLHTPLSLRLFFTLTVATLSVCGCIRFRGLSKYCASHIPSRNSLLVPYENFSSDPVNIIPQM